MPVSYECHASSTWQDSSGLVDWHGQLHRALDRYAVIGWGKHADAAKELVQIASTAPNHAPPASYHSFMRAIEREPLYKPALRQKRPALGSQDPAPIYFAAERLCIITSFFNPCGYRSRVKNFEIFANSLTRSGVMWRGIECAFGTAPFTLPEYETVYRVRSKSVLWQKERLLNLLIDRLPDYYTKVAWVDADILFSNPSWIVDTCDTLDDFAIVQPFVEAARLGSTGLEIGDGSERMPSFAYLYHHDPDGVLGPTYWNHGHTGYAWAARRDCLDRHGLYDACLSGTGDHLMAHAFVGDWLPNCIGIGIDRAYHHFVDWCNKVYPRVRARLGFTEGVAFSLWHGPEEARGYYNAVALLRDVSFDPWSDIALGPTGCWEWSSERPSLHDWARSYFVRRQDDG
jgi:hypothetical protein